MAASHGRSAREASDEALKQRVYGRFTNAAVGRVERPGFTPSWPLKTHTGEL